MKKLLFFSALFCSLSLTAAGTMHCRSGMISAAEVSTADIKIANFTGFGFRLPIPAKWGYATVTITPSDMRVVSIFDYSLEISGVKYPCVAIWNGKQFEYTVKDVQSSSPVQLLFIIDKDMIIGSRTTNIKLRSNLSEAKDMYTISVPFTVIGKKMPTVPANIPAAGILELPAK
ncbi:MAG: hypothetical protein E7058_03135 [Lentisphaerae bacterium]|nr:hypothetical protein [Lentisphaerota bacterium]